MPRAVRRNRDGRALRLPASTEFPRRSLFGSFVCAPASAPEPAAWTRLYREHWPAGQARSVYESLRSSESADLECADLSALWSALGAQEVLSRSQSVTLEHRQSKAGFE